MSLNMHGEKLKKVGAKFDKTKENRKTIRLENDPFIEKSEEEIIKNSPVAPQLQKMQTALFELIGPMAKIIFKDAVRDWIQSHDPSGSSIPILIEILKKEINDPEKEQRYLKMI